MALKYKVGDRVRIKPKFYFCSVDGFNNIHMKDEFFNEYSRLLYCETVMTISIVNKDFYILKEDRWAYKWTDEMIECKVEKETKVGTASNPIEIKSNANCLTQEKTDDTEPKFKVGDKIINGKTQLTILSIMSDKYFVEDNFGECGVLYFNIQDNCKLIEDSIIDIDESQDDSEMIDIIDEYIHRLKGNECQIDLPEGYQFTDEDSNIINAQKIILEKKSHKADNTTEMIEMNDMKRNACQKCAFAVYDDNPHCGLRGFRSSFNVEWCSAENDTAPNGYELQEDGYFSWVKKKKEYPKTYEECCRVLGVSEFEYNHTGTNVWYRHKLMATLDKLMLCRDAYWKLYGEEMGLGKPWEPDYTEPDQDRYAIANFMGYIEKSKWDYGYSITFVFPTAEMRDAFFENFKDLIEECKELL